MIVKNGDAGFASYLAAKEEILIVSPEPDETEEVERLLREFSKEEIEYYYFARVGAQWNNLKEKPVFEEYIAKFLNEDRDKLGWKDFDFSLKHMIKIHDEKTGHVFDEEKCERCLRDSSNPFYSPVSRGSSVIRDENIVREIKKYWDLGDSLFVVYGSAHAIVCERALKELLA